MEENQVRENIEDYRFSFKKIFLLFKKDIFGGEKNVEEDKILEEVAKIEAQEDTSRIQELCNNLENHQTIVKKHRRNTTRTNQNRTLEISINKNSAKEKNINSDNEKNVNREKEQNLSNKIDEEEKIQEI